MPANTMPDSPRILIVRLSAIGDTIHSLPLAAALRKALPESVIGWVAERPSAPLVENNPLLDWVHILPKGWLKSASQVRQLRRQLRAVSFDVAFDVQGLTKSAVAARLSGASLRIGFKRGEGRELAPLLDNRLVQPRGDHAVDITLSLLSALSIPVPETPEFVFPPCSEAEKEIIDVFTREIDAGKGFCLMGPWGSFAAKRWPLDRFADLAERLWREAGMRSAILGHGDGERSQVAAELEKHPGAHASPAPDVSVTGVVELARRAGLFVGCDSFPMHAAAGVGRPTIGLFGVTDPRRLGPRGDKARSVYERLTLVRSTRERRTLGQDNMLALTPERVAAVCLEVLR